MITIKNKASIAKMHTAGQILSGIMQDVSSLIRDGISTAQIDAFIAEALKRHELISCTKGYHGYKHVCCVSVNDEVVHGVPSDAKVLKTGDLVKVDICASYKGYCADMARCFFVGTPTEAQEKLVRVAQQALDKGIEKARAGNHLTDISAAIQGEVEKHGYGVVRDFAGHGIGKQMHEDPEILNYGKPGRGPVLQVGMSFAIEPMITDGKFDVYVTKDGWTVKTVDKSLAAHVEDTIVITEEGPQILTRQLEHR